MGSGLNVKIVILIPGLSVTSLTKVMCDSGQAGTSEKNVVNADSSLTFINKI